MWPPVDRFFSSGGARARGLPLLWVLLSQSIVLLAVQQQLEHHTNLTGNIRSVLVFISYLRGLLYSRSDWYRTNGGFEERCLE